MAWVKIDDGMDENRKIVPISDAAFRAYVTSICYSARNMTDGFIPTKTALKMAGRPRVVQELSEMRQSTPTSYPAPLWEVCDGGFRVHDFLQYNPSREEVMANREELSQKRATAGRKGAANRWQNNGKPDSKPMANARQTDGPVPDPLPVPVQNSKVDIIARDFANFGLVTPSTVQSIEYSVEDYGEELVHEGVKAAMAAGYEGKPPWSYVESTIRTLKEGGGKRNGRLQTAGRHVANGNSQRPVTTAEQARDSVERYLAGESL